MGLGGLGIKGRSGSRSGHPSTSTPMGFLGLELRVFGQDDGFGVCVEEGQGIHAGLGVRSLDELDVFSPDGARLLALLIIVFQLVVPSS